jgi:hypothetical protein
VDISGVNLHHQQLQGDCSGMKLRFLDDARDTAIDDQTGFTITRQGRADAGEFPLRIIDPEYSTPKVSDWLTFPVVPLDRRIDYVDEKSMPATRFEMLGYSIRGADFRTLQRYFSGEKSRRSYVQQLVEAYLTQYHRKTYGSEPVVEFLQ